MFFFCGLLSTEITNVIKLFLIFSFLFQLESTAMPYLSVLSDFREVVRKIAREKKGKSLGVFYLLIF